VETGGRVGTGSGGTGGASASGGATGGASATGGGSATGGATVTGGHATGGSPTGGGVTGGASATGGRGTGGATGGTAPATGGAPSTTGGSATGGRGTGGATGGMATGGMATGGAPAPTNRAPTVSAGVNQSTTAPGPITLAGSASDDGLPNPPGALTTVWSSVSGPGTVTFGNANALGSTASFSAAGTYTLRLSVSDGALTATDDLQVTVAAGGPCAGICNNPITADLSMGYSSGGLGTGAGCYQVLGPINGGNCGNFTSPRALHVNGVAEPCDAGNWTTIPAVRNGGTCIDVTAGGQSFAFFTLW